MKVCDGSHNVADFGHIICVCIARLAQSVEHGTLNPRVVGSSPTLGAFVFPVCTEQLCCSSQSIYLDSRL